jgi:hypothetical protein
MYNFILYKLKFEIDHKFFTNTRISVRRSQLEITVVWQMKQQDTSKQGTRLQENRNVMCQKVEISK